MRKHLRAAAAVALLALTATAAHADIVWIFLRLPVWPF